MPAVAGSPVPVARALVRRGLALAAGEHLLVASWSHTLPWAAAIAAEARRVGGVPTLLLEDETAFWDGLEGARSTRAWAGPAAPVRAAVERADAVVYFPGPADRPRLHALPSPLLGPLLGRDDEWWRLVRTAGVRGLRCLLGYASDPQAEHWRVPAATWRSQLIRGIVGADYAAIGRSAQRVARRLAEGRSLRLTAGNGTDLTVGLRGRRPWVDDGTVDADDRRHGRWMATSPPGSVVVAVAEGTARGTVVANRPSYLASGRADGAQWEIEDGRLRSYWYTDEGEAFEREFSAAPRGREVVGLVALGLNPAVARSVPQAEDLEAGTVTVAVGGNSLYGGRNRCAFLAWITVGEATVSVDGVPVCDRGTIL